MRSSRTSKQECTGLLLCTETHLDIPAPNQMGKRGVSISTRFNVVFFSSFFPALSFFSFFAGLDFFAMSLLNLQQIATRQMSANRNNAILNSQAISC
jgi:hypothetical protein